MIDQLVLMLQRGGPEPAEYRLLAAIFANAARSAESAERVREALAPTMTTQCIHGHGFLKPRGYAGDYEIIDRIYTGWESSDPALAKWDAFFHAQPAPAAVRNRKNYFSFRSCNPAIAERAQINRPSFESGQWTREGHV